MSDLKTTVIGICVGLIPIIQNIQELVINGKPINWTQVAFGVGLMALGIVAKDATKQIKT